MKEKLLISACLLGRNCKYNGGNNYHPLTEKLRERYDLVPVCPECFGGLPIPHEPSERLVCAHEVLSRALEQVRWRPVADVCADVTDLFNVMTGYAVKDNYRALLVSPGSMRRSLIERIQNEIAVCTQGGEGEIIMKCNQLVDRKIIRALYMASMAGVKVKLLVRGICCLIPGLPGISENITVKSIVGRFLEHARVYWFRNGGNACMFLGSADMMSRNLDRRIEVLVPVLEEGVRRTLDEILHLQLADNMQAWELRANGSYVRLHPAEGEQSVNSQELLLKR